MRILLVNWMDPEHPEAGGAERHLAEIFGRIAAVHEITLVAAGFRNGSAHAIVDGIRVNRVGGKYSFPLLAPRAVERLLAAETFDLVIEDLNKIPLPLRTGRTPRMVLVHHLWGPVAFHAASLPVALGTFLAERPIERIYRNARLVAVSESTRAQLIGHGLDPDRISVIRNAVAPAEQPLAGRSADPLFVYLGRIQRYKRIDRMITAAATLRAEGHRFRMVIAGRGPDARRIARLAERHGVADLIELRGWVSEDEKRRLLSSAWANVLMSMREGWGLTVLEAGREGTCSVVAHAPGLWEAVRHLEDGLWIPYHEIRTLADGLRYLIRNPAMVERFGAAARERANSRTWSDAAGEMLSLIETETNGRSAAPHQNHADHE